MPSTLAPDFLASIGNPEPLKEDAPTDPDERPETAYLASLPKPAATGSVAPAPATAPAAGGSTPPAAPTLDLAAIGNPKPLTVEDAVKDPHFDPFEHASLNPENNDAQEFAARVRAGKNAGGQRSRTAGELGTEAVKGAGHALKTLGTQAYGTVRALGQGATALVDAADRGQVTTDIAALEAQNADKTVPDFVKESNKVTIAKKKSELAEIDKHLALTGAEAAASADVMTGNVFGLVKGASDFVGITGSENEKALAKKRDENQLLARDLRRWQERLDANPTDPKLREIVRQKKVAAAQMMVEEMPSDEDAKLADARQEIIDHLAQLGQRKESVEGKGFIARKTGQATPEELAKMGVEYNKPDAVTEFLGTTPVEATAPAAEMLPLAIGMGVTGSAVNRLGATKVGGAIVKGASKVGDVIAQLPTQIAGRTIQAAASTPAKMAAGALTGHGFGHEIMGGFLGKALPDLGIKQFGKNLATNAPDTFGGAVGDVVTGKIKQVLTGGTMGVITAAPMIAASDNPAEEIGSNAAFGAAFSVGGKGESDRQANLRGAQGLIREGMAGLDADTVATIGANQAVLENAGMWNGLLKRLDPRMKVQVLNPEQFAAHPQVVNGGADAAQARGFFDPSTNSVVMNGAHPDFSGTSGHEGGHALFGPAITKLLPEILQQRLTSSVDLALFGPPTTGGGLGVTPLLRDVAAQYGKALGRDFDITNQADRNALRDELVAETNRMLTSGTIGPLSKFFSGPEAGQRGMEFFRDRLKGMLPSLAQTDFEFGLREFPAVTAAVRTSLYELGKMAREGSRVVDPNAEATERDEADHTQAEAARAKGTPEAESARGDAIAAMRKLGYNGKQAAGAVDAALASGQTFPNAGALTKAALSGAAPTDGRTTTAQQQTMAPKPPGPTAPAGPGLKLPETVVFADQSGAVPTQYRVVEASEIEGDPANERPQPGSPAAQQLQQRNAAAVQNFDPSRVINTNPTPSNGPTIVYKVIGPDGKPTGKYRIAGGHQRHEIITQAAEKYRAALESQAQAFDPDATPEALAKMKQPILVREVDAPADEASRAEMVRKFNDSETAGIDKVSDAVSAGKILSDQALQTIASAAANPVGTPRSNLLDAQTQELRAEMVKAGVIRPQDMERMVAADGRLTAEGVELALSAAVGNVIGDTATIRQASPGLIDKITGILPKLLQARANGVDIGPIADAIRLEIARKKAGMSLEDFQSQPTLPGEPVPSQQAMRMQTLLSEMDGQALRQAFDKVVSLTAPNEAGQASLLGGDNRASIGDITDQELSQIAGGQRITPDLTPRAFKSQAESPLGTTEPTAAEPARSPLAPETPPAAPEAQAPVEIKQTTTLTPRPQVVTGEGRPTFGAPEHEMGAKTPAGTVPTPATRTSTLPAIEPEVKAAVTDSAPLERINANNPGLTTITESAKKLWASIKDMLPKFQGNKTLMGDYVISAIERAWSPEERAKVRTIVDNFAGGGAWGFGLGEAMFPNVDRYIINEYDPIRHIRIQEQYENGDKFAQWATREDTRAAFQRIVDAANTRQGKTDALEGIPVDESEGSSWGGIVHDAKRIITEMDPVANREAIAVLKTMTDDPDRTGDWYKGDRQLSAKELEDWFVRRHAPIAAAINARYREAVKRGTKFEFRRGDAYDPELLTALDPRTTMVVADPPYFATTGYGNNEVAEGAKNTDIVGLDIYRKTRDLMSRLDKDGHSVLYTDEAWWLKPKVGNNVTDGAIADGANLAGDIANSLDLTVVDGKIGSRYETLGLRNGLAERKAARTDATAPEAATNGPLEAEGAAARPADNQASRGPLGSGGEPERQGRGLHGPDPEPELLAGQPVGETRPADSDRGPGAGSGEAEIPRTGRGPLGEEETSAPRVETAAGAGPERDRPAEPSVSSAGSRTSPLGTTEGDRTAGRSGVDAAAVRRAMDAGREAEPVVSKTITTAKDKASGDPEAARAARHAEKIARARLVAEAAPLRDAFQQHARDNGIDPSEPRAGFLPKAETAAKRSPLEAEQDERYKGLTARTFGTRNPETGETETRQVIAGKFIDPADPLHKLVLEHNGIDQDMAEQLNKAIESRQAQLIGYGHAKAGGTVTAQGRRREQKASPARQRLLDASTAQPGDKVVIPQSFTLDADGSLSIKALDFDKFNQNAQHLLDFMEQNMPAEARALGFKSTEDPAYTKAAEDYAANHAAGYKGDGSAPVKGTVDNPVTTDPDYTPRKIPKATADFLNAAYGDTSAMGPKSAGGAQARELAKANDAYPVSPEALPDVNPLRARIDAARDTDGTPLFKVTKEDGTNAVGFKDIIENANSNLKAGLVDGIQPATDEALRDSGIRLVGGKPASPFGENQPRGKFVAAGFLPKAEGRFDDNRRVKEGPLGRGERTDAMGTRSRDVTRPGDRGTTLRFGEPVTPNGRLHAAQDGLETKDYDNASVTGPGAFFLPAYHGTGHKFDKFDISKIGTGEGAQVYGWGLYFASQLKTALEYRRNLSRKSDSFEYDGKRYNWDSEEEVHSFHELAVDRILSHLKVEGEGDTFGAAAEAVMNLDPTGGGIPDTKRIADEAAANNDLSSLEALHLQKGLDDVIAGLDWNPTHPYAGDATRVIVPRLTGGKRAIQGMAAEEILAYNLLRDRIGSRNADVWTQKKIDAELNDNAKAIQGKIDSIERGLEAGKALKNVGWEGQADAMRRQIRVLEDARKLLESGKVKFAEEEPPGFHYEVDLKTDDDNLLSYDASIAGQRSAVKEKLAKAIEAEGKNWDHLLDSIGGGHGSSLNGGQLYNSIATRLVSDKYNTQKPHAPNSAKFQELVRQEGPKLASEWLLAAGIDGIKYADGFTRNKRGEKTHNYVMFSDSKIETKTRNERPLPNARPEPKFDEKGQGALFLPKGEKGPLGRGEEAPRRSQRVGPLGMMDLEEMRK